MFVLYAEHVADEFRDDILDAINSYDNPLYSIAVRGEDLVFSSNVIEPKKGVDIVILNDEKDFKWKIKQDNRKQTPYDIFMSIVASDFQLSKHREIFSKLFVHGKVYIFSKNSLSQKLNHASHVLFIAGIVSGIISLIINLKNKHMRIKQVIKNIFITLWMISDYWWNLFYFRPFSSEIYLGIFSIACLCYAYLFNRRSLDSIAEGFELLTCCGLWAMADYEIIKTKRLNLVDVSIIFHFLTAYIMFMFLYSDKENPLENSKLKRDETIKYRTNETA